MRSLWVVMVVATGCVGEMERVPTCPGGACAGARGGGSGGGGGSAAAGSSGGGGSTVEVMPDASVDAAVLDAGVDAAKIPVALRGGRADSAILQEYLPRFAAKDYRRTGRIDNMVKDLNGALDLARRTHTAMPLTALCAEIHRMLTAAGLGGEDQAALMEFFKGPRKETFE